MAARGTARTTRRRVRRAKTLRTPRRSVRAIVEKLQRDGPKGLSPVECCRLVLFQLGEIADWQQQVWDKIWGSGGGGTPPPPPKWPPA